MIYDIHVHLAGMDYEKNGNFVSQKILKSLPFRLFRRVMGISSEDVATGKADDVFKDKITKWIKASLVDRVVLLAYDPVYKQDGEIDWAKYPHGDR